MTPLSVLEGDKDVKKRVIPLVVCLLALFAWAVVKNPAGTLAAFLAAFIASAIVIGVTSK